MKNSQENLESLIEAINELLNEVRKEQITENKNAEKMAGANRASYQKTGN